MPPPPDACPLTDVCPLTAVCPFPTGRGGGREGKYINDLQPIRSTPPSFDACPLPQAEAAGVKEIYIDDLREEFVRDFVWPMFRCGVARGGDWGGPGHAEALETA